MTTLASTARSLEWRRMPSWARGALVQSVACYGKRPRFARRGGPAALLVPGMFCTAAVMTRLGRALEARGADCFLPRQDWPLGPGFLANTGSLEASAALLRDDLAALRWEEGVEEVTLVGHSNGALISLLALEEYGACTRGPCVRGVIALAAPFGGSPLAPPLRRLFPAAADVAPGSPLLLRVASQRRHLLASLVAERDFLVPDPDGSHLGVGAISLLPGQQHMDCIVGSGAQVEQAADLVARALPRL